MEVTQASSQQKCQERAMVRHALSILHDHQHCPDRGDPVCLRLSKDNNSRIPFDREIQGQLSTVL